MSDIKCTLDLMDEKDPPPYFGWEEKDKFAPQPKVGGDNDEKDEKSNIVMNIALDGVMQYAMRTRWAGPRARRGRIRGS
jgi:hypothetical protein